MNVTFALRLFAVLTLFAVATGAATANTPAAAAADHTLQWWTGQAEAGRPDFQFSLGKMYETGEPNLKLAADPARAEFWYQRAAEQGHSEAQSALQRLRRAPGTAEAETRGPAVAPLALPTPARSAGYWSWWLGGIALAAVSVGFWLALGVPLGASSSWDRIVSWRRYRQAEAADEKIARTDRTALADAMLAETLRQFGPAAAGQLRAGARAAQPTATPKPARLPWGAHITFLLSLMLGGVIAAISTDTLALKLSLHDLAGRSIGDGWLSATMLAAGGVLVGFGARMAGGCSSGHGLTGCAWLQPGSLLATASFFTSAVVLTLLLVNL